MVRFLAHQRLLQLRLERLCVLYRADRCTEIGILSIRSSTLRMHAVVSAIWIRRRIIARLGHLRRLTCGPCGPAVLHPNTIRCLRMGGNAALAGASWRCREATHARGKRCDGSEATVGRWSTLTIRDIYTPLLWPHVSRGGGLKTKAVSLNHHHLFSS